MGGSWQRGDLGPPAETLGVMRRAGERLQKALPEGKEPVSRRVGSSAEGWGGWPLKLGKGRVQAWAIPRAGPTPCLHVSPGKARVHVLCLEFIWASVITSDIGRPVACRTSCCPALVITLLSIGDCA